MQPTLVFLPGKSHGQRSLVGCRPWGEKRVRHNLVIRKQQFQEKNLATYLPELILEKPAELIQTYEYPDPLWWNYSKARKKKNQSNYREKTDVLQKEPELNWQSIQLSAEKWQIFSLLQCQPKIIANLELCIGIKHHNKWEVKKQYRRWWYFTKCPAKKWSQDKGELSSVEVVGYSKLCEQRISRLFRLGNQQNT